MRKSDQHLDFDLDPSWWHLDEVCRQAERRNYQGRVAIGHATKLSALPPDRLKAATARLAKSGVAVTVLPATDLYLMGRDATHNAPRGLTVAHKLVAYQGMWRDAFVEPSSGSITTVTGRSG